MDIIDRIKAARRRPCMGCGETLGKYDPVTGARFWPAIATRNSYHPSCAPCSQCKTRRPSRGVTYHGNKIYHSECVKCATCKMRLEMTRGRYIINYGRKLVHSDCFPCSQCNTVSRGHHVRNRYVKLPPHVTTKNSRLVHTGGCKGRYPRVSKRALRPNAG